MPHRESSPAEMAEVQRAFGSAFIEVHRLEAHLVHLIQLLDELTRPARHDVHSFRGRGVWLRGLTMGQLVDEVETLAERAGVFQDGPLLPLLNSAVDTRNAFAHGYFSENLPEYWTSEGCKELLEGLARGESYLSEVATRVLEAAHELPNIDVVAPEDEAKAAVALLTRKTAAGFEVFSGRATAIPRVVDVVQILIANCGDLTETGYRPILLMTDRRPLTVGSHGLCAWVEKEDAPLYQVEFSFDERVAVPGVPCRVKSQPKLLAQWHYDVGLANGWFIEVRPGLGGPLFSWALRCHS